MGAHHDHPAHELLRRQLGELARDGQSFRRAIDAWCPPAHGGSRRARTSLTVVAAVLLARLGDIIEAVGNAVN